VHRRRRQKCSDQEVACSQVFESQRASATTLPWLSCKLLHARRVSVSVVPHHTCAGLIGFGCQSGSSALCANVAVVCSEMRSSTHASCSPATTWWIRAGGPGPSGEVNPPTLRRAAGMRGVRVLWAVLQLALLAATAQAQGAGCVPACTQCCSTAELWCSSLRASVVGVAR